MTPVFIDKLASNGPYLHEISQASISAQMINGIQFGGDIYSYSTELAVYKIEKPVIKTFESLQRGFKISEFEKQRLSAELDQKPMVIFSEH
jgi:hypothetical protein